MQQTATDTGPPTIPVPATKSWWQQQAPSPGYAPLDGDARVDVVVIGGGVAGCSSAWHLARAGARVKLLEARTIAAGASGRNGGFLLAGMAHRPVALAALTGAARAAELYEFTAAGRERLYEVAERVGARDHATRSGSLRLAVDVEELDELHQEATLLEEMGSVRVQRLDPHELPRHLVGHFLGGLHFPDDGRSMPTGWVRALGTAAVDAGAILHEQSPVVAIEDDDDGVVVRTSSGAQVRADHAVVATEAWLPALLPELRGVVLPYRSQVLAAAPPLDRFGDVDRVLPHVTWSRRGWDYAQQAADGTLIVGGERGEHIESVRVWDEEVDDSEQAWIESWIQRVLGLQPDVRARWAGLLGQTVDGFPVLGHLPSRPRVVSCGGWGGAGNVLGFVGGSLMASLLVEREDRIPPECAAARLVHDR